MPRYYAHSDPTRPGCLPDDPGVRWQTLREHLLLVARLSSRLASHARPGDDGFRCSARWTGLLHDLGKYNPDFLDRLLAAGRGEKAHRVPHSAYGAAHAAEHRAYHIALAVLGHHAGLPPLRSVRNDLTDAQRREAQSFIVERAVPHDRLALLSRQAPPHPVGLAPAHLELYVRMLFSCLVDADRLDCLRHSAGTLPLARTLDPERRLDRLLDYVAEKAAAMPEGPVKAARQTVLKACLEAAPRDPRLWSLAVPTGGGKTLAAMAFALRRAMARPGDVRRVIVVIPYLSIIDQSAAVYREALGDEGIIEHHSGDFQRRPTPTPESEDEPGELELAMENWDAPIIITTSVRFFDSLFSNRPADLRRLHNVARSVVIVDEVQTLPVALLTPLLSMMKGLADDWNVTFVFATATQPAFERSAASSSARRWPPGTITHIVGPAEQRQLFSALRRVQDPRWPARDERLTWDELADRLAGERAALCIVNVRRHAAELCRRVAERVPVAGAVFHLSTYMCPQHRLDRLAEIRARLDRGEPCLVVSTQLVEAGVHLDFPVVYRAMAPLDSIIQAAGRCDREGKLTAAGAGPGGRLVIFWPEDGSRRPYGDELDVTATLVARGPLSIHDPDHIRLFFDEWYEKDTDERDIEAFRHRLDYPEVAARFALIDSVHRAVLVPYNTEATALIRCISLSRSCDRDTLRLAYRYHVGLYPRQFEEAARLGAVVPLWPEAEMWRCMPSCYDAETGLVVRPPGPGDYMVT